MPYVPPHRKVSRPVTKDDIERVMRDGLEMYDLCWKRHGFHQAAMAIAHSQIEKEDPMRFFVDRHGDVFINPTIVHHSSTKQIRQEGCMSYPLFREANVDRWYRIEAEYWKLEEIEDGKVEMTGPHRIKVKGVQAQEWQHELDHFEGKYVWPYVEGEEGIPENIIFRDGWPFPTVKVAEGKVENTSKVSEKKEADAEVK